MKKLPKAETFELELANTGLNKSGKSVTFTVIPSGIEGQAKLQKHGIKSGTFWVEPKATDKGLIGFRAVLTPVYAKEKKKSKKASS